ncbi:M23 family metallopeptidase [Thioalkalivibrio sulfidiphilus]|uniref:Peptidase M23 n=1 Tax=Thioalkalivibrio sulfidiphilus (strain HL-EbGR7) TaxID=396588 RepID=B8GMN8_THISH|nr:M23 family metallopeptidase [Thioalkalivibrio sulfidiphilus]ACL71870.1 Peptidase M23 [Thioalkalivibrio sulfidiphilus HL-EbGr7]
MNIIFLSRSGTCRKCLDLHSWRVRAVAVMVIGGLLSLVAAAGFHAGARHADPQQFIVAWEEEIRLQREALRTAREATQADIDALTIRLAELQARATRLDALGGKLVNMAGLDDGEFDFSSIPGVGGPEMAEPGVGHAPDLIAQLDGLDSLLEERESQLGLLDRMILNRQLQEEVTPAGRPVNQGWISSSYGMRNDPFTGRRVMHRGVDFAGRPGSDVIAVAGGIVTTAGKRNVFGYLVEIDHGNGFVTRYAHNKKLLVETGETVRKGQVIALLGETGRATGPHVHFEVLENGRHINPSRFIRASR